jgi:hypothetical protein
MLRTHSPFDDLPTRRMSVRMPLILTGLVVVAAIVSAIFGGPFFSFEPERECRALIGGDATVPASDPVSVAIAVSRSAFPCADIVVVAPVADAGAVRTASEVAIAENGPLLLVDGGSLADVLDEVERLEPEGVVAVELGQTIRDAFTALELDVDSREVDPDALGISLPETAGGPVIVLDAALSEALPAAEVVAAEVSGRVLLASDLDLSTMSDPTRLVLGEASALRIVGGFDPGVAWELEVSRSETELPGGGHRVFPDKRLVGFYGSPLTTALGVLGEQGPEDTAERMESFLEGYGADGLQVVPTFELIATVASAAAGPDGDYSDEASIETLRPWVDYAAAHGIYVVLDLQPGRSDFLSQAKRYEELLRQPHVGLALDPEWRLGPNQIHLDQIGAVHASEINEVAEWLAGIVREDILPQKVFLVHQFRESMITDRVDLISPRELAMIIQMDGQGPLATKFDSFESLTEGWSETLGYWWGWKNFFDEDDPMASPAQVLGLRPIPLFVSFQ